MIVGIIGCFLIYIVAIDMIIDISRGKVFKVLLLSVLFILVSLSIGIST